MLCLLRALIAIVLAVSISYAGEVNSDNSDVREVVKSLNSTVSAYTNSTDWKNFKKLWEKRKKEIVKVYQSKTFKQMRKRLQSQRFQEEVNNATREIIKWTGKAGNDNWSRDLSFYNETMDKSSSMALIVFLSSSMGRDFDTYVDDMSLLIDKESSLWNKLLLVPYGVLRGVINDEKGKPSILRTVSWLRHILKGKRVQILIDPLLFRQYRVDQVPCLLLTKYDALQSRSCSEAYFGCGYSVFGFLAEVEKKTADKSLKELLRKLD